MTGFPSSHSSPVSGTPLLHTGRAADELLASVELELPADEGGALVAAELEPPAEEGGALVAVEDGGAAELTWPDDEATTTPELDGDGHWHSP
jgi:hypothetical protein